MKDHIPEIKRAKELLNTVKFATMATVNEDGSPHNTPFLFLHDKELNYIYWGSYPESQHSKNILRTGQIFVVVYDAFNKGGLYIRAENGHITQAEELDKALEVHNEFRKKAGKYLIQKSYYEGTNPQRMWSANTTNFWVNGTERGSDGHLVKDYRIEIKKEDLID